MGLDYGWEKFFSALRYAIASEGTVQERLEKVMCGVCHLERDSFDNHENWIRFQKLLCETTRIQAQGNEGNIRATTSRMTNDQAVSGLEEAFDLFAELAEAYGRGEMMDR